MRTPTSNPPINNNIYKLAIHSYGLTIGPMPAQDFLDTFLPQVQIQQRRSSKNGVCSWLPVKRVNDALVSLILFLI